MKLRWMILFSLVVSLFLTLGVTWPLGREFNAGIPSTYRPEPGGPRHMIAGDHLQFLYQLWMLGDVFRGQTPVFSQLYEFNQGDDNARREVGSYYFPFGLLYATGDLLCGRAAGWNIMIFVSAWLTYLATWLLALRFCSRPLTAAVAALPGLLLPYYWACLLGGSPTGPGMLWIPVIFLGLDMAIRDRNVWGGLMAGGALYMSPWADLHVFFFVFLVTPVWMVWCLLYLLSLPEKLHNRSWKEWVAPLSPVFILMVLAYMQTFMLKHKLSETIDAKVRKLVESTSWHGWFAWDPDNRSKQVYIGAAVGIILLLGLIFMVLDAVRGRQRKSGRLFAFTLLFAAVGGIAVLALGPNTPFDGNHLVWRAVKKLLPPYGMIRQPAKVFCILAPFLTVGLALSMERLNTLIKRRWWTVTLAFVCAAAIAWDYGRRIEPTICLLDYEQGAYRAIADDAARSGRDNRAMAIPIWPGDSHWNSQTEYYSTLYRTKMLNGYRPGIRKQYFTEVFERLEPMNLGCIADANLEYLLSRRIGYLLLQEDAFPDKVSHFPVVHTLYAMLSHPRLEYLARDRETWAFKILAAGEIRKGQVAEVATVKAWLPARRWKAKDFVSGTALIIKDAQVGDGIVRLAGPGDCIELPPRFLSHFEGLRYMVAVRGSGSLRGSFKLDSMSEPVTFDVPVERDWTWQEIPVPKFDGAKGVILRLTAAGGQVDVDVVTVMGGDWKWIDPGESLTLPAATFFRAGYSDLLSGTVQFDATRVSAGEMLYAPALPVRPGNYRVALDYESPALAGTDIGELSVGCAGNENGVKAVLHAGQPVVVECPNKSPRPLSLVLHYNRKSDLTIKSVTLTRIAD